MRDGYLDLAIIAILVYLYGLVSARLRRSPISGALVFLILGVLLGPAVLGWLSIRPTSENLKLIAELTLSLILFTDAANANLSVLRRNTRLPVRLLALGLPLTILLGVVVGAVLFPDLQLVEVAILSVVLAPTDAALGQPVVSNSLVPAAIREDLSVESGLNDGICVPLLLALLAMAGQAVPGGDTLSMLGVLFVQQLGLGLLLGVTISFAAVWGRDRCRERSWISDDWQPLLAIALPLTCFAVAQELGGSGFIACFTGGLLYGALTGRSKAEELVAAEATGNSLSLVTWVAFGSASAVVAVSQLSWSTLAYAVLSLTVVRMVPVALVMGGMGRDLPTKLFVGWFGPRGLASIVFAVLVLDAALPHGRQMVAVVTFTILLSILAHGLSASPLAGRYGPWMKTHCG
ncbi:MAG: cation:proton antiporter [Cyanobium sp. CZS 25K]|nr:cation:proton antiporter [Cyanobium sp. CZS25K]